MIKGYMNKFKKSEQDFLNAIRENGNASLSSPEQNMKEHWDVKLELKFDVKALKKVKRENDTPDENIHWVELLDNNGRQGWLYGGSADYFSFETNDYWILVSKEKLQKFISDKCADKQKCERPELYKLYTRNDRKDVITLVKTIDLIFISDQMIKKEI